MSENVVAGDEPSNSEDLQVEHCLVEYVHGSLVELPCAVGVCGIEPGVVRKVPKTVWVLGVREV